MNTKTDLGQIKVDADIKKMLEIIKLIFDEFEKQKIKIWFNGTFGVVGYYGKFFEKPNDIDCGVLEKDFDKAKQILESIGCVKVLDKENPKFKVSIYKKEDITVEIGTFDHDLGNNFANIEGARFPIPDKSWLAQCYRITAQKDRRKGRNDLARALFLESL